MTIDAGDARRGPKSDINVTPLVDVMLVLLIIMMLIAPMIREGGAVALPAAAHSRETPDTPEQTVVAVDARGLFYVNALPVANDDLVPRVRQALGDRTDRIVYLKGDKDAKYAAIMHAMDALRAAQIENIAFITERTPRTENSAAARH
jgi:biopolymer transport protein TolR